MQHVDTDLSHKLLDKEKGKWRTKEEPVCVVV